MRRHGWQPTLSLLLLVLACPFALAQPASNPPASQPEPPRVPDDMRPRQFFEDRRPLPDTPEFRARAEEFLTRRLEVLEREVAALREGKSMLEAGKPLNEIRDVVRSGWTQGMGERAAQMRDLRQRRAEQRGDGEPPMPGANGDIPGDRPGGPGPWGAGRPFGQPPAIDGLLAVLQELQPDLHQRMTALREEDPDEFNRLFSEYRERLARFWRERQQRPDRWPDRVKLFRLEMEAIAAAKRVTTAPAADRAAEVERLRALINEQVDFRLKFQEDELGRSRARSEKIEGEIADIRARRAERVEMRMREMISRAERGASPEMPDAPPPDGPPHGPPPGGRPDRQ